MPATFTTNWEGSSLSGEKRVRSSSFLLNNLKNFFGRYGSWEEPFRNFPFFGKVRFSTVHTTFFLKDYQIDHFLYLFGAPAHGRPESVFEDLRELSRELLTLTADHYLSSFCILDFGGNWPCLYGSKNLWLGFRGRVEWGLLRVENGRVKAPEEMESIGEFLTLVCFKGGDD